jgi:hypothetical protein
MSSVDTLQSLSMDDTAHPARLPRTSRRRATGLYALAMFATLSIGLIAFQLIAESEGRGGKAGWEWAVPLAALLCLLPAAVFGIALALLSRNGLAAPPGRIALASALCGAATPALLFGVGPLVRVLGLGSSMPGGLALALVALCAAAVASALLVARTAR